MVLGGSGWRVDARVRTLARATGTATKGELVRRMVRFGIGACLLAAGLSALTACAVPPALTYATKVGITPRPGSCGDPDPSVVAARLAEIVATGASFIRCDLDWSLVQAFGPTDWEWTNYDNLVEAAGTAGIR